MARGSGISQDELRRVNLSAVLTRVHVSGPTSRAALTTELGLNRSTIGGLTTLLEALGLVSEVRPTESSGSGRPSHLVVPREDVTVVAVGLDVDRIVTALVGLGGVVLARRERPHHRGTHDAQAVAVSVLQSVHQLLALTTGRRCIGIGVSLPGVVRASDGLVRFAPNLGWVDQPFTELLQQGVDLPVRAGNDANLGVLAEHLRGAAVGIDDVAYVTGGVGIGGGFLVGGQPLRGSGGYAGEIGHLLVENDGRLCRCGATGCWETRVGENHLLEAAGRLPGGGPRAVAEVISAAGAGDRRAAAAVDEVALWAGVGLRAMIIAFNPRAIVLGGVLGQLWRAREEMMTGSMSRTTLQALLEQVQVMPAGLGEDSPLLGAAELAFEPLLADPMAEMAGENRTA